MPAMTMLLLSGLMAGLTTAPPAGFGAHPKAILGHCAPTADKVAGRRANRTGKLGDEPPAAQIRTVYRVGPDGCPQPVVLRDAIGANPEKALPLHR